MCEIVCKTCGGRSLDNFLKRAAATRWGNGAEAVPGASVSLLSPLLRGQGSSKPAARLPAPGPQPPASRAPRARCRLPSCPSGAGARLGDAPWGAAVIQGRGPGTAAVAGHRPPTLLVPSFLRGFERPLVLVRIWNLTRGSPRCFCRERWPQVTPQTVPSARGAQTRGQRVRGRGLRPARAEPAQRWLGAGRRPSGSRRPRPPDPKSSRAPGRAARRKPWDEHVSPGEGEKGRR